jgi:putative copper resistance protein D
MELIVAVRSIHIGAAVVVAGAFAFQFLVWPRSTQPDHVRDALARWLRRSAGWATELALLTWAIWLALIAATMSGASPSLEMIETVLARTNFGHVWILRFALGLLVLIELRPRRSATGDPALGTFGAVAAVSFLVSLAWAGHAVGSQGPVRVLHLSADALHLLGAGLWLGALLPLCFVLHRARSSATQAWLAAASAATGNFSSLGVVAVLTIVASGVVNTALQVGSFAALVQTQYGQLVSAKIALLALIVVLAGYNRLRLVPRIQAGGVDGAHASLPALYRNALIELVLGAAIIMVVGLLGNMAPSMHFHPPGMHHMGNEPPAG